MLLMIPYQPKQHGFDDPLPTTHLAPPVEEYAVTLDIPVDDPTRVQIGQSLQAGLADSSHLIFL